MHKVGTITIYTAPDTNFEWVEQPQFRIVGDDVVTNAAGQINTLQLAQNYCDSIPPSIYANLSNHWLRVSYTPHPDEGGDEFDLFFGHLCDQTLAEGQGEIHWTALSIEAQLARVQPMESFAEPVETGGKCQPISMRTANESLDTEHRLGWRGVNLYHFNRTDSYREKADAEAADTAYVFGQETPWDAYRWLEHLLVTHCPTGGSRYCPIGFELVATAEAQAAMEAVEERWGAIGHDLLRDVSRLVQSGGDLAWHVDWTSPASYACPYIRVWSRTHADKAESQSEHAIKGAVDLATDEIECTDSNVTIYVRDQVTDVVAVGEPIRVQFSVRYQNVAGQVRPTYVQGWTGAEQAEWALDPEERDPNGPSLTHVFRRLYLPESQKDGDDSTWEVFARPLPGAVFADEGDMLFPPSAERFYARPRRVLPHNLTRPGYVYTSQGAGALSINTAGAAGEPDPHPILAWFAPSTIPDGYRIMPLHGVQPLRHECGVMLPNGWRQEVDDDDAPDTMDLSGAVIGLGQAGWQYLVITLTIETDERASWTASATGISDSQRRVLVVQVPEARWDVALEGTVIAFDEAGAATTVHGVIRNDVPKLKAVAEKYLGRYAHRAWHADLPLVKIRSDIALGDFITTYGPYQLNNAVLALRHHLRAQAVGTELITGKPWEGRIRV